MERLANTNDYMYKKYLGFGSVFLELHDLWVDGGIAHPLLRSSMVNWYGTQKSDSFPGGLWDPNVPLNNHQII